MRGNRATSLGRHASSGQRSRMWDSVWDSDPMTAHPEKQKTRMSGPFTSG